MKQRIQLFRILLVLTVLLVAGSWFIGSEARADRTSGERIITDLDADLVHQNLKEQLSNPLMIFGVTTDLVLLGAVLYILLYQRKKLKISKEEAVAQTQQLTELTALQSEAKRYYQYLFNSLNDGIVVSEMEASGALGRIIEVNKQASLILGRSEEELLRLTPMDLLESNEKIWFPDLIHKLQADHALLNQFRVVTSEGKFKVVEVHANLIESQNDWKVVAVIRDVTDRAIHDRMVQKQIDGLETRIKVQATEIDQLNQEVTFLAGTISHDLQAPLQNVQESLENIKQTVSVSDQKLAGEMDGIIHRIQRTNSLVKGILEYSRLARKVFDLVPVGLSQICSEVLLQLDTVIREENADVIIERPMPRVLAHSTTLFYVIQNLIMNALKFSKPGVKPHVVLRAEACNGNVRLWVIDNGIGIAPEYHDRIFQVFQRLHSCEEYPGNGLGLAIVKRGVQRMNGTFGLMSEIGEGSRFWIELPVVPEENRLNKVD